MSELDMRTFLVNNARPLIEYGCKSEAKCFRVANAMAKLFEELECQDALKEAVNHAKAVSRNEQPSLQEEIAPTLAPQVQHQPNCSAAIQRFKPYEYRSEEEHVQVKSYAQSTKQMAICPVLQSVLQAEHLTLACTPPPHQGYMEPWELLNRLEKHDDNKIGLSGCKIATLRFLDGTIEWLVGEVSGASTTKVLVPDRLHAPRFVACNYKVTYKHGAQLQYLGGTNYAEDTTASWVVDEAKMTLTCPEEKISGEIRPWVLLEPKQLSYAYDPQFVKNPSKPKKGKGAQATKRKQPSAGPTNKSYTKAAKQNAKKVTAAERSTNAAFMAAVNNVFFTADKCDSSNALRN